MLEENHLVSAGGMENNQLKTFLIYFGLFLAGAIITPIFLGLLSGGSKQNKSVGDRPESTTSDLSNGFKSDVTSSTTTTTNNFEPNDSKEAILKDYEVPSPEALKRIPVTLPQYAMNQPAVKSYPNYWANISIPQFSSSIPPQTKVTPKKKTAISTAVPVPSMTQAVFTPPKDTTTDPSNVIFKGNVQPSANFNLNDFLGKPVTEKDSKPQTP